ncbi:MAG TPA: hypothetical protein VGL89_02945 [Candidatus Koribacter sp.]
MSEAQNKPGMGGSIGSGLGSMARYALNPKARNKVLRATGAGLGATAKAVRRATHRLWLEVTGFFFVVFAVIVGGAGWREYQKHLAGKADMRNVYLAGALALIFVWFGITSFWKARRQ